MNPGIQLIVELRLTETHALALAALVSRMGFQDYRGFALDAGEADDIREGVAALRVGLAEEGFLPQ